MTATTTLRVLYLDSDAERRALFEREASAGRLPFSLATSATLKSARAVMAEFNPDVVLSAALVEDGTAVQLLPALKKAPLVVLVDHGEEEEAALALKEGAADYLVRDSEERFLALISVVVENVLKRRKQKETLQMFSHAVMKAGDSIYLTSTDDTIIFVNDAFLDSHGYRRDEILGTESKRLFARSSTEAAELFQREPLNDCRGILAMHRRKDHTLLPVYLSRSIIRDDLGQVSAILTVAREVSQLESVEKEKLRVDRQLLRAESAEVTAQMLREVIGPVERVLEKLHALHSAENSHQADEALESAWGALERLKSITSPAAGTPCSILVHHLLPSLMQELAADQPELSLEEFECGTALAVQADFDALTEVLAQLLRFSGELAAEIGGTVSVRADLLSAEEAATEQILGPTSQGVVRMRIRDSGPRLPASVLDELFRIRLDGFSGDTSSALPQLGIAQLQIKRYGGVIIYRPGDSGNCFELYLPGRAVELLVEQEDRAARAAGGTNARRRILFVDDEIPLVKLAALVLGREGFKVTACSTGAEALQRFEQDPWQFDIVVADQTMPKMRGDLLGKIVLGIRPDIPMILCEGYGAKTDAEQAALLGFRGLLKKPYRFSDLAALIHQILTEDELSPAEKPQAGGA